MWNDFCEEYWGHFFPAYKTKFFAHSTKLLIRRLRFLPFSSLIFINILQILWNQLTYKDKHQLSQARHRGSTMMPCFAPTMLGQATLPTLSTFNRLRRRVAHQVIASKHPSRAQHGKGVAAITCHTETVSRDALTFTLILSR